ncbi:MAG: 50S ribosomal protein L18 [Candidatus Paracaedibacteraceae bacterium]|nr:50S ribosomal protein L18 [Candidatus Paracaedibacteraceae bacterium]
MAINNRELNLRRQRRNRYKLKQVSSENRLRLSVFRSNQHIYAQVIDDKKRHTIASASTVEKEFQGPKGGTKDAASLVGKLVAERAVKAGIKEVYFDRGGYLYHGRVKALADGARENGLVF